MRSRVSAGILLYRVVGRDLEVLLAHMGGPLHAAKDLGSWTIPKGEAEPGETDPSETDPSETAADEALLAVALREFAEETGQAIESDRFAPLGSIVQKGGKVVHAWAVEGDLDPASARSNTFRMVWPPRSGMEQEFPEIDRVAWFRADEARARIKAAQAPFIDRLEIELQPGR